MLMKRWYPQRDQMFNKMTHPQTSNSASSASMTLEHPSKPHLESINKLVNCVQERGKWDYPSIVKRLKMLTADVIIESSPTYHRQCYQEATNKSNVWRAQARYEDAVKTQNRLKCYLNSIGDLQEQPTTKTNQTHGLCVANDLALHI